MKFPYIKLQSNWPNMPIIPVRICHGERSLGAWALIDSGATRSIFDAQYADSLRIESVEDGEPMPFTGVTGHRLVGYLHQVTLQVGGLDIPKVGIVFCYDMLDAEVGILGQNGFFDKFPIKFTYSKKQIDLMTAGGGA